MLNENKFPRKLYSIKTNMRFCELEFYFLIIGYFLFISIINVEATKQALITGHPFNNNRIDDDVYNQDNKVKERITLTFPGTKWCGPGDIANGYDDLGKYRETDKCCRAHDHCENIPAGGEKYGLRNDDWFTRLHCDCDKTFYNCLHATNQTVGNIIGKQYFLFRDRCFKEDFQIVECVEYQTRVFIRRCIKYRFDTTQPKLYQWFDLPLYDIESYPNLNAKDIEHFYKLQANHQQEILLSKK